MSNDLFGPWTRDLTDIERVGRLRELRAICLMLLGRHHRLVGLLRLAERNERASTAAWLALENLEPLRQRRVLSVYAELAARGDESLHTEGDEK